jgi:hypothetical protein
VSAVLPPPERTPWSAFRAAQDQRRAQAQAAAVALREGDAAPARRLLAPWAFASDSAACSRVLDRLLETPPVPDSVHLAATLGPVPATGPDPAGAKEQRAHLFAAAAGTPGLEGADPVAWGLEGLAWLGARIHQTERVAWQQAVTADPLRDAAHKVLWRQFLDGQFWDAQAAAESLWLPAARRGFAAALRARGVPAPERKQYVADYAESFFWMLLGGRDATPGWKEVAVRLLERDGASAPSALADHLGPEGWSWVVRCPSARSPTWRAARRWALPDHPNPLSEAWYLCEEGPVASGWMEHLLDGLVALRLLAAWSGVGTETAPRTRPKQAWDVVLRNRGRTRGRLRAVLLEIAGDALLAILRLPGLASATHNALAAVGWSQAHVVLHKHGLPSWDSSLTPTCEAPPPLAPLLPVADEAVLRTWMLLVVLRGRWAQLDHWGRTGTWHTRPDSGWGRLLKDGLPHRLGQDGAGYARIQAHLNLHGPRLWASLRPALEAVAAATKGKEIRAAVEPYWEPEVGLPSRMTAGAADGARVVLAHLDALPAGTRP